MGDKNGSASDALKSLLAVERHKALIEIILNGLKALDPRRIRTGRVESFDAARTRLKVNNDEIEQIRVNHVLSFWGVFLVLAGAWSYHASQPFWLGSLIVMLGFSAMCLSLMFQASFRASQLKARTLHSVAEWAGNFEHWLPWF